MRRKVIDIRIGLPEILVFLFLGSGTVLILDGAKKLAHENPMAWVLMFIPLLFFALALRLMRY